MLLVVWLTLLLILIIVLKYKFNKKYKDIGKIPGPKALPLIGNCLEFGTNVRDIFNNMNQLIYKYGPFVRIWFGPNLMIMLADPNKLEGIFNSTIHINKSRNYNFFKTLVGNGLVTSKGQYWKKQRKLITPTFHFKMVNQFVPYINSNLNVLLSILDLQVDKSSFNIFPYINLYALDTISETAMSTKMNAQIETNSDYVKAIHSYMEVLISRMFTIYKHPDILFSMCREYKQHKKDIEILQDFVKNVIKKRKQTKDIDDTTIVDSFGIRKNVGFLDLLLNMGNQLSENEILDEVNTFMFAGHDTVTSTISFALYSLSKHQAIQERVYQESIEIIGSEKSTDITMHDISNLQYFDMVFKECMRYYPAVPFIERELFEPYDIDGLSIPIGTVIQILVHALHHSDEYYPEPEEFIPERFLPEVSAKRHPYAYIPFSAGSRNCIGQRYAILTCKATIIKIIRHFHILPAEIEPILCNKGVLVSENGIHVKLLRRT